MADLVEIDLAWRAAEYGETEPLIERFLSHGLQTQEAKAILARLARGQALRRQGRPASDPDLAGRDQLIRMLVANRKGLLKGRGQSDSRAVGQLVKQLPELMGVDLQKRQVDRIAATGGRSLSVELAYQLGLEGFELAP